VSISEHSDVPRGASAGLAQRLEIFTGAGRRRSWTSAQKAAIVAESFEDGALVGHVARRHGLTPQQLFNWRRQARREADEGTGVLPFAPVVVETPSTVSPPAESVESKPADARSPVIELDIAGSSVWICDHRRVEGGEVIGPSGAVRVLVATHPVDFRKGTEGLAALVRDVMGADPFDGAVYVFRAKRADRVKLVYWDGTGVCLFAKRLEDGRFQWPKIENGVMRLSTAQLSALIEGLDWKRVGAAKMTPAPRLPG
jgi:transposase